MPMGIFYLEGLVAKGLGWVMSDLVGIGTRFGRRAEKNGRRHPLEGLAVVAGPQLIGGNAQHPMMNELILTRMFGYCDPETLRSCRRVCAQWHKISFPVWLENGPPILLLRGNPEPGRPGDEWAAADDKINDKRRQMTKFVQEFHQGGVEELEGSWSRTPEEILGIHQYPKFHIKYFDHSPRVQAVDMDGFWRGCGNWLTSLHVEYDADFWPLSKGLIADVLSSRHTPNLEHLQFTFSHVHGIYEIISLEPAGLEGFEGEHLKLKSFRLSAVMKLNINVWEMFFNHYPNLERIEVDKYRFASYQLQVILRFISEIRQKSRDKLQLKTLSWFHPKDSCELTRLSFSDNEHERLSSISLAHEYLASSHLDLESFGVYFNNGTADAVVTQVCTMYWKTLKELRLYKSVPLSVSPFGGRDMDKLTTLVLGGNVFKDLQFLKDLPNLRSLKFVGDADVRHADAGNPAHHRSIVGATTRAREMLNEVFPLISTFSCNFGAKWSVQDIDRLGEWMPNITQLEVPVGNEAFKGICENFPSLEQLVVFGDDLGDGGMVDAEPNITNLQELRDFRIFYRGDWKSPVLDDDVKITERSVLEGLLRLPRLRSLSICVRPAKMDPATMELIRQNIPFAKLLVHIDAKKANRKITLLDIVRLVFFIVWFFFSSSYPVVKYGHFVFLVLIYVLGWK